MRDTNRDFVWLSLPWARLVETDFGITVLELRDPNHGKGLARDAPRHQYCRAGGAIWTRTLPPESVGDEWADIGSPPWTLREPGHPGVGGVIDEWADGAPALPVAAISPLVIRGGYEVTDRSQRTLLGPVLSGWWCVPLPPCPQCGGALVWAEAGSVPGVRRCDACNGKFLVETTRE